MSTTSSGKEIVSADAVMQSLGNTEVKPPFVQRAGLWLAAGVGALIAIVTIVLLVFLYTHYPRIPATGSNAALPSPEQYKALTEITIANTRDMFQTIVAQALLPVFTAILGYIFAKGAKESDSPQ